VRHQRGSGALAAGVREPCDQRYGRDGRDTSGAPARHHQTNVSAADVAVSVRDAGTGLPADINGTLFKPFVTTKSHGLGIGLTIARRIVDVHGGIIDAHNNPEGGATFTVTLRRSETPKILSGPWSAA
jgi:signal transduction histidine kinase